MEQSYKEKYEDILARLERAKNDNEVCDERFCCVINEIIPELAESEDEKIRKEIIDFLKLPHPQFVGKRDHEKWIAWLGKQKEYESTDFEYVWDRTDCGELTSALDKYSEEAIINMCHAWYDKGIELERKSWLEKQDPKKHEEELENAYKTADKVQYKRGYEDAIKEMEKQGEKHPEPYNGISFEYNGHIWGMCARDGGVEILMDGNITSRVFPDKNNIIEQKPTDSYCQENCKGFQETGKCFADGGCKAKREAEQKPEENKGNIGGISANWSEEDEMVRKDLIGFFKDEAFLCHKKKQIIAWLKKQGDSPIKWNKNTKDCKPQKNHSVLMKTTHGIAEGEWQGEKWFQYRWSSSIKDSDVLFWIELSDIEKQGETFPVLSNSSNSGKNEQKPAEWSEEDKKIINGLIDSLTRISLNTRTDSTSPNYTFYKEIDWLKSLRPQSRWKPSELQLECLSDAIEYYNSSGYPATKLKELYEQLKKL